MKKLLAVLLCAVVILTFSACKSGEGSGSTVPSAAPPNIPTENVSGNVINSEPAAVTQTPSTDVTTTGGGTTDPTGGLISRERALEIALQHAGLSADQIRDLEIELDREPTGYEWEVDFDYQKYDYSYDINAQTGEIIHSEKELDD